MIILGINSATGRTAVSVIETGERNARSGEAAAKKVRETAEHWAAIKNAEKTRVLFDRSWDSDRDEAEKILPAVKAGLKKIRGGAPGMIFTVRGPGSFTGLRVGVTIANMLASVLRVKVAAIDTFEYLRERAGDERRAATAVILKAGGEFVAVLLPGKKTPHRLSKDELSAYLKGCKALSYAVTDMSAEERKAFGVANKSGLAKKGLLPKNIKWLPENRLSGLSQVILKTSAKIKPQKTVAPKYLLPPKITKSKKPAFTR